MIDPPLARVAMIAMAFTQVPILRPATQYSSPEPRTRLEAAMPMPMQAAK
jgi:hypothetical protein